LLLPDGLLSAETYLISADQPSAIKKGCVLIVDPQSGVLRTVHETRLFPEEADREISSPELPQGVCLKCGRVMGIVEDQVACPFENKAPCGLLEITDLNATTSPPNDSSMLRQESETACHAK
jgi:hypothetical protein